MKLTIEQIEGIKTKYVERHAAIEAEGDMRNQGRLLDECVSMIALCDTAIAVAKAEKIVWYAVDETGVIFDIDMVFETEKEANGNLEWRKRKHPKLGWTVRRFRLVPEEG
jgi:hypothetical protein